MNIANRLQQLYESEQCTELQDFLCWEIDKLRDEDPEVNIYAAARTISLLYAYSEIDKQELLDMVEQFSGDVLQSTWSSWRLDVSVLQNWFDDNPSDEDYVELLLLYRLGKLFEFEEIDWLADYEYNLDILDKEQKKLFELELFNFDMDFFAQYFKQEKPTQSDDDLDWIREKFTTRKKFF